MTAARPMNDATSMWSAPIRCEQPRELLRAVDRSARSSRCPRSGRPSRASRRHRSCTCGSQAALHDGRRRRDASDGAISAFSVPVTVASSRYISAPRSPLGARRRYSRPTSTSAPSAASAIRWVSTRRRPITSPPGGGTSAAPKRASSGPASRIDARIRSHSSGSSLVLVTSAGPHAHRVLAQPLDVDAERDDQLDHLLDVPDARDVLERHRVGGQQAGCEDGERGVLVAGRAHGTREGRAALDQKRFHSASSGCDRHLDRVATFDAGADGPAWGAILAGRWRTTWCMTATRHGSC